jgi:hypothetical protein
MNCHIEVLETLSEEYFKVISQVQVAVYKVVNIYSISRATEQDLFLSIINNNSCFFLNFQIEN